VDELLGHTMMDMYPGIENTELFDILRRCMQARSAHHMENEFTYPDGSQGWFELSIQPMPEGLFILSNDVTERKLADKEREAKLILEAKNTELDHFAYTVSHDLRSPLVTIKGFLNFLIKDLEAGNTARMKTDLNHVENAVNKMQELLTGVLELSRAGLITSEPQAIHMDELVHEVLEIMRGPLEASKAQVSVQTDLPTISGDRTRLRQVIQNLIENAVKYRTDQVDPRIEIGVKEDTTPHVFYVRDNGMGIAPEKHEHVFGLFNKLHPGSEGNGVGLATVKRIIEAHGGRIWIESELGQGCTFLFTLSA